MNPYSGSDEAEVAEMVSAERRPSNMTVGLALALLAVIALATVVTAWNSERMVDEQRRTTCLARVYALIPRDGAVGDGPQSQFQAAMLDCLGDGRPVGSAAIGSVSE